MGKSDVIDLSDLVKAIKFKFNDQDFEIPPIPDDKLKSIMNIANKITKISKESDDIGMTEEFIEDHNNFLSMAVEKKIDDENYDKMKPEDFVKWPLKLKNKVMELVFDQIGTSSGEKITPEAEKN